MAHGQEGPAQPSGPQGAPQAPSRGPGKGSPSGHRGQAGPLGLSNALRAEYNAKKSESVIKYTIRLLISRK